ncbi:MAG: patatin-like phospholipase family protein [Deltaproteobacteria bacterium]|nr:patatin-like phospholipase family protein [Deltaproteobacteria bacterium]
MPRIGLVLGAGGIIGASYITGALEGIRRATGWEPQAAELIIGTSAGAFIGGLTAAGLPTWLLHYRCTGELARGVSPNDDLIALAERMDRYNEGSWLARYAPPLRFPRPLLSSPRAVLKGFVAPRRTTPAMVLTGLLPEGVFSIRALSSICRTAWPSGWPKQATWVTAIDLESGRRVVFGREGAPRTDLHLAVGAACAVPGIFAPVAISGRRYVDAGSYSPSNLDLAAGLGLDLVVCISPLSCLGQGHGFLAKGLGLLLGPSVARRLRREREKVEATGTPVHVVEPTAEDMVAVGWNWMDISKRPSVMSVAVRTTHAALCEPRNRWMAEVLRGCMQAPPSWSEVRPAEPGWH